MALFHLRGCFLHRLQADGHGDMCELVDLGFDEGGILLRRGALGFRAKYRKTFETFLEAACLVIRSNWLLNFMKMSFGDFAGARRPHQLLALVRHHPCATAKFSSLQERRCRAPSAA